jgi:hypothetical protein
MLTAALIAVSVQSQNVSKKYREMEEDTSITKIAAETDDESVSVKHCFQQQTVLENDIIADYMIRITKPLLHMRCNGRSKG